MHRDCSFVKPKDNAQHLILFSSKKRVCRGDRREQGLRVCGVAIVQLLGDSVPITKKLVSPFTISVVVIPLESGFIGLFVFLLCFYAKLVGSGTSSGKS